MTAAEGLQLAAIGAAGIFVVRWQCPQGHFVADASIHCEDYRDPGAYYGISTVCRYSCRACGETYQDLPRCVEVGRRDA